MKKLIMLNLVLTASLLVGCASTEYKTFEGRNQIIEGMGGTKIVVDGMEIWDNGDPPRKFTVLGIIDDERPGGLIQMSQLRGDVVQKARAAGGDAVILLNNQSQITGYYSSGSVSSSASANSARAYGSATTVPVRRNSAKFAVIKYVE